jgi:hypothetical protein
MRMVICPVVRCPIALDARVRGHVTRAGLLERARRPRRYAGNGRPMRRIRPIGEENRDKIQLYYPWRDFQAAPPHPNGDVVELAR